jgi:hypothetical protein
MAASWSRIHPALSRSVQSVPISLAGLGGPAHVTDGRGASAFATGLSPPLDARIATVRMKASRGFDRI